MARPMKKVRNNNKLKEQRKKKPKNFLL